MLERLLPLLLGSFPLSSVPGQADETFPSQQTPLADLQQSNHLSESHCYRQSRRPVEKKSSQRKGERKTAKLYIYMCIGSLDINTCTLTKELTQSAIVPLSLGWHRMCHRSNSVHQRQTLFRSCYAAASTLERREYHQRVLGQEIHMARRAHSVRLASRLSYHCLQRASD